MRSVRLDDETEARLQETARVTGEPVSAIIRGALRRRCDEVLGQRLDRRLADIVGVVASGGGSSRKTGRDFAAAVEKKVGSGRARGARAAKTAKRSGRAGGAKKATGRSGLVKGRRS